MQLFTARGLVRRVRSPPTCKVSGGDASRSLIEIGLSPAFRKLSARVMIETGPALRHLCRTISLCLADRFGMDLEWFSNAVANPKRPAALATYMTSQDQFASKHMRHASVELSMAKIR